MIGRELAHYRITAKLGEGGMGEVYLAVDTKLDRDVALKVLPAATVTRPERLSRFIQEAKSVAGLNHPNIVTLYSVDEADGVHFLTMELVVGNTLDVIAPGGALPLARILELSVPIVDALGSAHAQGVVHRDLKPGNIMVTDDGGRIKVLDFGLAKLVSADADHGEESSPDDVMTRTREGMVLGTPHYMAPEQARGESVDHRADIYAFGVLLFELATGRRPFEGKSSIELLSAVLRDPPPIVTDLRPDLPPQLAQIVARCLEKAPEERYATAGELADDLIALGNELVVKSIESSGQRSMSVPPTAPSTPTSETPRHKRRTAFVVVSVAVVAMLAAAIALWGPLEGEPASTTDTGRPVIAVLPFENLGSPDDEYFADGITDEITSRLSRVQDLGVISRTSARVYKGTTKSVREIGTELNTGFVLEGTIRWNKSSRAGRVRISPRLIRVADDTHMWSENYERDVTELFTVQAEIATQIADALGVTLVANERDALTVRPTDDIDAYQAYLQGMKFLQAPGFSRDSFALGVQMFERAVRLDDSFALAWARLASMHARTMHYGYDRSDARRAQAKEAVDHALELAPEMPEAHLALGLYYYWATRDFAQALSALDAGRAIAPNHNEIWLTTAYVKRRQGDLEAAIDFLERDVELSPLDPNAAVGLGETYGSLRRYAEGEQALNRAIALAPEDPYPYTELALLYLRWRGDTGAARAILEGMPQVDNSEVCRVGFLVELLDRRYDAALSRLAACPGPALEASAFYVPIDLLRAMTLRSMQDDRGAAAAFEDARILLARKLDENRQDHRLHSALGMTYAGLGRVDDAVRHGRKAVELYPLSRDALEATVPMIDLALTYTMAGEHDAAVEELDAVLSIPSILSVSWLEADPFWDPLRGRTDFEALIERHSPTREGS